MTPPAARTDVIGDGGRQFSGALVSLTDDATPDENASISSSNFDSLQSSVEPGTSHYLHIISGTTAVIGLANFGGRFNSSLDTARFL